jgi:hypothetical protein
LTPSDEFPTIIYYHQLDQHLVYFRQEIVYHEDVDALSSLVAGCQDLWVAGEYMNFDTLGGALLGGL